MDPSFGKHLVGGIVLVLVVVGVVALLAGAGISALLFWLL